MADSVAAYVSGAGAKLLFGARFGSHVLNAVPAALVVLLLAAVFEFVEHVGFSALSNALFTLRQMIFDPKMVANQRKTRLEILNRQTDLRKISPKDQFAKWARLRREVLKMTSDYENANSQANRVRAGFMVKAHVATRVVYWLSYSFVVIWLSRTPMFFLPQDWVGPVLPLLSMPLAPSGSVSVVVWMLSCRHIVRSVYDLFGSNAEKDEQEGSPFSMDAAPTLTSLIAPTLD